MSSTTPINERNEWRTPEMLVNYCRDLMGGIDFDTACTLDNAVAKPVWYDINAGNALSVSWTGRCFCNPPYDNIAPWVEKALESTFATTAMVLPSPNGERVYHDLLRYLCETHIIGRISFIGADGKPKNGNPRGTSIFLVNPGLPFLGLRSVRRVVQRSDLPGSMDRPASLWMSDAAIAYAGMRALTG